MKIYLFIFVSIFYLNLFAAEKDLKINIDGMDKIIETIEESKLNGITYIILFTDETSLICSLHSNPIGRTCYYTNEWKNMFSLDYSYFNKVRELYNAYFYNKSKNNLIK